MEGLDGETKTISTRATERGTKRTRKARKRETRTRRKSEVD